MIFASFLKMLYRYLKCGEEGQGNFITNNSVNQDARSLNDFVNAWQKERHWVGVNGL